jgi:hypothetical protein
MTAKKRVALDIPEPIYQKLREEAEAHAAKLKPYFELKIEQWANQEWSRMVKNGQER